MEFGVWILRIVTVGVAEDDLGGRRCGVGGEYRLNVLRPRQDTCVDEGQQWRRSQARATVARAGDSVPEVLLEDVPHA
ncbi:hypothetical protein SSPO_095730 [Streptomyces antimycoticus]|uniref:Uncharacterized protein n=1 Tax=Streptomyces antimycoticus TaxID=68175 RepID=A0A499UXB0_9ACTN|nr:hypothetical protein SSPO_095730 [Streptomyces antimycoticus]